MSVSEFGLSLDWPTAVGLVAIVFAAWLAFVIARLAVTVGVALKQRREAMRQQRDLETWINSRDLKARGERRR